VIDLILFRIRHDRIKDTRETGIMSEEKWTRVQGMSYSELKRGSYVGLFIDDAEKKYKDK
jgi:hypothetical protein